MIDYDIRKANPDDIPFIYSTWLNSYRYNSVIGKSVTNTVFFNEYRQILDRVLEDSTTNVACLKDDPSVILGYITFEPGNIIHYCFIKEAFRGFKIAKSLVLSAVTDVKAKFTITHMTKNIESLDKIYNPFILYRRAND